MRLTTIAIAAGFWALLAITYAGKHPAPPSSLLHLETSKKAKTQHTVAQANHTLDHGIATFASFSTSTAVPAFLQAAPQLVPYAAPNNELLFRNIETPGQGWCGWAALSLGFYGTAQQTAALRATLLQFVQDRSLAQLEALIYQATDRDPHLAPLTDIERRDLQRLQEALQAAPGIPASESGLVEGGSTNFDYLADMTNTGAVIAAVALNRPIRIFTRYAGHAEATLLMDINTPAPGEVLNLHIRPNGGHWEGLLNGAMVTTYGLAGSILEEWQDLDQPEIQADLGPSEPAQAITKGGIAHLDAKALTALEDLALPLWQKSHKIDDMLSAKFVKSLTPCPVGRYYVKILRFSNCLFLTLAAWTHRIEAERTLVLNWIQTFDAKVQRADVVIIVLQRPTLESVAEAFEDGKCEKNLPATSKPSYLRDLRRNNLIKMLILASPDGFLSSLAALQRFLYGYFDSDLDKPCLPIFSIVIHSHTSSTEDIHLPAQEILDGVGGKTVEATVSDFVDELRFSKMKRLLNSLSSRTASQWRNNKLVAPEHLFSLTEAQRVEQLINDALQIESDVPLTATELAKLPLREVQQPQSSFRLHRFSYWNHQWPFADRPAEACRFLQDSVAQAREATGDSDGPWYGLAIGLSALEGPAWLAPSSKPTICNFPSGAAAYFAQAVQQGSIGRLSVPTPDSLFVGPKDLQSFLTANFGETTGTRIDFDLHISSSGATLSSWELAQALGAPLAAVQDPHMLDFLHALIEARISRRASILAARFGGAAGRNAQNRVYPVAPAGAYEERWNPVTGWRTFACRVKSDCTNESRLPSGRDRHYHACADTRTFQCLHPGCKVQGFSDFGAFTKHQATHSDSGLPCPHCDTTIKGKRTDSLNRHIKASHPAEWKAKEAQKQADAASKGSKSGKRAGKGTTAEEREQKKPFAQPPSENFN